MMNRISMFVAVVLACSQAHAVEIEGVQPASLDQPRVHVHLRRTVDGPALSAAEGAAGNVLSELLGDDAPASTTNIQAFLDTGASGVMISKITADALGIAYATATAGGKDSPQPVVFHDVGVGGSEEFRVSEKLYVFLANWGASGEPDEAEGYPHHVGPLRAQIPIKSGLLDSLTGGLDVAGMPVMQGKIIVINPQPVDTFSDTMRTKIFDADDAEKLPRNEQGVPVTDRHVRLSYASFTDYTFTAPKSADGPTIAPNPFIGPGPALEGRKPPSVPAVVAVFNGQKQSGSWLLDTGAAASIISEKQAEKLGVTYVEATRGGAEPKLEGIPATDQFSLPIGGVGGQTTVAGFFLDELILPTAEGDPLVYKRAPVLVKDITVKHRETGEEVTLDGVFGMNYLVASAHVTGGLLPDIGQLTAGPFEWIVFDEPKATLGLKLKKELLQ